MGFLTIFALCLTQAGATWGAASKIENAAIEARGLYDIGTASEKGITSINITADGVGLTGENDNLSVIISGGITLTLKNANITSKTPESPIKITSDDNNYGLVLIGENTVKASGSAAGVNVPSGTSLTIMGPGTLIAIGSGGGAGIGGNFDEVNGTISIKNAKIAATGGAGVYSSEGGGAGIGTGGSNHHLLITSGYIEISNSSVQAAGGKGNDYFLWSSLDGRNNTIGGGGAGIGGGGGGGGDDWNFINRPPGVSGTGIKILKSNVKATGGVGGDGIDGIDNASCGSGGGAGIGGGGGGANRNVNDGFFVGGDGENIEICANSVVRAIGGNGGNVSFPTGGGGGGGAAIGGGGGSGSIGVTNNNNGGGAAGVANGNTLNGGRLASCSRGGIGGTSSGSEYNGGNGALCGKGGKGGYKGEDGEPDGNCQEPGELKLDFALRPSSSDLGYSVPHAEISQSNRVVTEGHDTEFTVKISGGTEALSYPLSYQWLVSTNGGNDWSYVIDDGFFYSGADTDKLTLTGVTREDGGNWFLCVVTDFVWREVISGVTILAVNNDETAVPPDEPKNPPGGAANPPVEKPVPPGDDHGVSGCANTNAGPGMLVLFAIFTIRVARGRGRKFLD